MGRGRLARRGLDRMDAVLAGHADRQKPPGLVWALSRRGEVHVGTAGELETGVGRAVARDSIFRIASMTKPVVAVAALMLVEECRLRLDDPVDDLLPELADRQVVATAGGPLSETVPAERPITVDDVLTFRLGLGMDFAGSWPQPLIVAMAELGLASTEGPPEPTLPPAPDEWMRRIGTLPLIAQPGQRWLYNTGADVLGVLVTRASDQPLDVFLRERIFEPLGMVDTGFWVPADTLDRFGACHGADPETGDPNVFDPADGQWSQPPAFPSGAGGLVSTIDDYLAFAELLLGGGARGGTRLLSRATVEAMTTDQLTDAQREHGGPGDHGALGWGLGVGVARRRAGTNRSTGSYGWDGGLGSTWSNDPAEDLIGIVLTNQMWTSSALPPPATTSGPAPTPPSTTESGIDGLARGRTRS